jgi:uncharacterized protein (TIGR04255 family)
MAALFPETPREHYAKAPLVLMQVVCQLKFPKLLRIESAPPAEFQEKIRDRFPLLQPTQNLPMNLPPEVSMMFGQQVGQVNYQFTTEDRSHTIALSSESLSLTASVYKSWEMFVENFRPAVEALNQVYSPSFYNRAGLRYVDAIDRKKLGLADAPWSRLLKPQLLGELSIPEFELSLEGFAQRAVRLKNPDGSGSILLQHGIAQNVNSNEPVYVIDIDFFSEEKIEVQNAIDALTHFNRLAGNAFRWCITDELRNALEPTILPPR